MEGACSMHQTVEKCKLNLMKKPEQKMSCERYRRRCESDGKACRYEIAS
jgi:hypothetical protein